MSLRFLVPIFFCLLCSFANVVDASSVSAYSDSKCTVPLSLDPAYILLGFYDCPLNPFVTNTTNHLRVACKPVDSTTTLRPWTAFIFPTGKCELTGKQNWLKAEGNTTTDCIRMTNEFYLQVDCSWPTFVQSSASTCCDEVGTVTVDTAIEIGWGTDVTLTYNFTNIETGKVISSQAKASGNGNADATSFDSYSIPNLPNLSKWFVTITAKSADDQSAVSMFGPLLVQQHFPSNPKSLTVIIIAVVGAVTFASILGMIIYVVWRRRRTDRWQKANTIEPMSPNIIPNPMMTTPAYSVQLE